MPKRKELDVGLLVALYEEGNTTREVAEILGTSSATVTRRLQEAGVSARPNGQRAPQRIEVSGEEARIRLRRSGGFVWAHLDGGDVPLVRGYYWSVHSGGYVHCVGSGLYIHRLIIAAPEGLLVDHKDGDRLNNRRRNLRIVDPAGNAENLTRVRSDSSTGIRGVGPCKFTGRWIARVKKEGKYVFCKRFDTLEEAAAAVQEARREFMPLSEADR